MNTNIRTSLHRLAGQAQVAWLVVATLQNQSVWSWVYRSHWDFIWGWQTQWSLIA